MARLKLAFLLSACVLALAIAVEVDEDYVTDTLVYVTQPDYYYGPRDSEDNEVEDRGNAKEPNNNVIVDNIKDNRIRNVVSDYIRAFAEKNQANAAKQASDCGQIELVKQDYRLGKAYMVKRQEVVTVTELDSNQNTLSGTAKLPSLDALLPYLKKFYKAPRHSLARKDMEADLRSMFSPKENFLATLKDVKDKYDREGVMLAAAVILKETGMDNLSVQEFVNLIGDAVNYVKATDMAQIEKDVAHFTADLEKRWSYVVDYIDSKKDTNDINYGVGFKIMLPDVVPFLRMYFRAPNVNFSRAQVEKIIDNVIRNKDAVRIFVAMLKKPMFFYMELDYFTKTLKRSGMNKKDFEQAKNFLKNTMVYMAKTDNAKITKEVGFLVDELKSNKEDILEFIDLKAPGLDNFPVGMKAGSDVDFILPYLRLYYRAPKVDLSRQEVEAKVDDLIRSRDEVPTMVKTLKNVPTLDERLYKKYLEKIDDSGLDAAQAQKFTAFVKMAILYVKMTSYEEAVQRVEGILNEMKARRNYVIDFISKDASAHPSNPTQNHYPDVMEPTLKNFIDFLKVYTNAPNVQYGPQEIQKLIQFVSAEVDVRAVVKKIKNDPQYVEALLQKQREKIDRSGLKPEDQKLLKQILYDSVSYVQSSPLDAATKKIEAIVDDIKANQHMIMDEAVKGVMESDEDNSYAKKDLVKEKKPAIVDAGIATFVKPQSNDLAENSDMPSDSQKANFVTTFHSEPLIRTISEYFNAPNVKASRADLEEKINEIIANRDKVPAIISNLQQNPKVAGEIVNFLVTKIKNAGFGAEKTGDLSNLIQVMIDFVKNGDLQQIVSLVQKLIDFLVSNKANVLNQLSQAPQSTPQTRVHQANYEVRPAAQGEEGQWVLGMPMQKVFDTVSAFED